MRFVRVALSLPLLLKKKPMSPSNRIHNAPELMVEDMLTGWLAAHADCVRASDSNPRVVQRTALPLPGKVGILTGGGSGHEPAFLGYVGNGMCDAVAVGEIFSSPTAKSFYDAMRAVNGGCGVACLYGNYAGDNMNVKLAIEMAARDGIEVKTVIANDDVLSAAKGDEARRRGGAGEILMWKVAAARADAGASLDEVIASAQKAINHTRSIGIGLSACIIAAVGHANFHVEHGTMEVGIGHHGEPGADVRFTVSAGAMAEMMLDIVLADLPVVAGDRVALLLSGLGATPLMEQYILYGEIERCLRGRGIGIEFNRVGNLFTSLEMMGVTLTVMKLDDELLECLRAPCESAGLNVSGPAVAGAAAALPKRSSAAVQVPVQNSAPAAVHIVEGAAITLDVAGDAVRDLIGCIIENRAFLSEIDGLIGDGDHGINMAKGFAGCGMRLDALGADKAARLPLALEQLSQALMDDIGGSMGPLYGSFFSAMANTLAPHPQMDAALFGKALRAALHAVQDMGNAQIGDKTLIDTLAPADAAYHEALRNGAGFAAALQAMEHAAEVGKNSTKALQARIGRSAWLGPRSIGVMDAGAVSCWLIVRTLGQSLQRQLGQAQ